MFKSVMLGYRHRNNAHGEEKKGQGMELSISVCRPGRHGRGINANNQRLQNAKKKPDAQDSCEVSYNILT